MLHLFSHCYSASNIQGRVVAKCEWLDGEGVEQGFWIVQPVNGRNSLRRVPAHITLENPKVDGTGWTLEQLNMAYQENFGKTFSYGSTQSSL